MIAVKTSPSARPGNQNVQLLVGNQHDADGLLHFFAAADEAQTKGRVVFRLAEALVEAPQIHRVAPNRRDDIADLHLGRVRGAAGDDRVDANAGLRLAQRHLQGGPRREYARAKRVMPGRNQ